MEVISRENLEELIEQKKTIYRNDITKFHNIGKKFVEGEITAAEFKASSGGMGVYAQRGGKEFMIRLRIPSGILDINTLKLVKEFVKDYSLSFVHFTTRQTIQLHNLSFEDVIHIMERSIEHNLFTRGGGGHYPRNVSLSPLSGVAKEEAFDVTPYVILFNRYFLSRMDAYKLPRKFKTAFSNNSDDTANATIADLGFLAVVKDGMKFFKVYIGGSMGANGEIAIPYGKLVKPEDILYHLEACLSLFVTEGDFENKAKARMRYIVKRMGAEAFMECYEEHLKKVKETLKLDYVWPTASMAMENTALISKELICSNAESLLDNADVIEQKQEGLYTVVLHPQGGIMLSQNYLDVVDFLEKTPNADVRLSMEESMYVRNLSKDQADKLLELTKELRNTTRISRSICCVGVPICQIGIQESQKLLRDTLLYFEQKECTEDLLPSLYISGCMNSCGRHQVNEIGFQGKKKRIGEITADVYTLYLGGKTSEEETCLAKDYGDLRVEVIPAFLYEVAMRLKELEISIGEYQEQYMEEFHTMIKLYQGIE